MKSVVLPVSRLNDRRSAANASGASGPVTTSGPPKEIVRVVKARNGPARVVISTGVMSAAISPSVSSAANTAGRCRRVFSKTRYISGVWKIVPSG